MRISNAGTWNLLAQSGNKKTKEESNVWNYDSHLYSGIKMEYLHRLEEEKNFYGVEAILNDQVVKDHREKIYTKIKRVIID